MLQYRCSCKVLGMKQGVNFGIVLIWGQCTGTMRLDGWATFEANARIGGLLKEIRSALDGLLREKIENPEVEENARGETIVKTILQLLNSEV